MQLHFLYLYYKTAATPSLLTEMLTHSPRRCVPHCRDCSSKGLCDKAPHRRQGLFCDETAGLGVPILFPCGHVLKDSSLRSLYNMVPQPDSPSHWEGGPSLTCQRKPTRLMVNNEEKTRSVRECSQTSFASWQTHSPAPLGTQQHKLSLPGFGEHTKVLPKHREAAIAVIKRLSVVIGGCLMLRKYLAE